MSEDVSGLSTPEAEERIKEYGHNVLPEKPPPTDLKIFIDQLKNPLVYVLVFAGIATLFLRQFSDSIIIFIAVLINTVLGYFQEKKANTALVALKKMITHEADVVRDGSRMKINSKNLVPGDVVFLGQGSKVPADGRITKANRLFIDEAILTGESMAVSKKDGQEISMGTIVSSGQCMMVVEATGEHTKVGKIALEIQEPQEDTPLKKQLTKFSKSLVILILALTAFVFVIGLITRRGIEEMFTTSVALAVSAIPEGLLVGLTVILAIGMQRILKRKGLVRNLVSAETLGGVTTICLDKTGTLTQGVMQVVEVSGNEKNISVQGILANDLDDPLVVAVNDWALKQRSVGSADKLKRSHKRLDSIPFSAKDRYFMSLNVWDSVNNMVFVNGAPEVLIEKCALSREEKERILSDIDRFTGEGKRLIGMVRRKVSKDKKRLTEKDIKDKFEWVGVLVFSDPVRRGVKTALDKAKAAGIKLIVITGDYVQTAVSVMHELGLEVESERIVLGDKLEKMSGTALSNFLMKSDRTKLFARTTPQQKLKIVESLKGNGEVVAMMGDGVNDAPAINRADIGIVVGNATDVARESADLVLLDSRFETVIAAIEEGRGIFDNTRKVIIYLMCTAFNEITAVVGAILLGLPLPVTAAQILWINIISNGFPDLALTVEPKRRGIMSEPPRSTKEPLVAYWMKMIIAIVSVTSGLLALGLFVYTYKVTGDEILSRSVGFVALGINSLIYVFSVRTLKEPFWKEGLFENRWLVVAVFAGLFLQLLPFFTQATRGFFSIVQIPSGYWIAIFVTAFIMFFIIEILKVLLRVYAGHRFTTRK